MLSTAMFTTGTILLLSSTPFLIRKWRQYRLRRIAPEYPRAKVVKKRISGGHYLLMCQMFYLEGKDSFFSTKGELRTPLILVEKSQYHEVAVGSDVVLEKKHTFVSADNRILVQYMLHTNYPEALDFFWNKEKIVNLCG